MSFTRGLGSVDISPRAYPFAFPLAVGLLLDVWGMAKLVESVSTAAWSVADLFWIITLLTVGTIILIVGSVGAVFVGIRGWSVE